MGKDQGDGEGCAEIEKDVLPTQLRALNPAAASGPGSAQLLLKSWAKKDGIFTFSVGKNRSSALKIAH